MRHISAVVIGLLTTTFSLTAAAQLSIGPTNDATSLTSSVVGSGSAISIISSTYVGGDTASGTYSDGPLGIGDGILLTSGLAVSFFSNIVI